MPDGGVSTLTPLVAWLQAGVACLQTCEQPALCMLASCMLLEVAAWCQVLWRCKTAHAYVLPLPYGTRAWV